MDRDPAGLNNLWIAGFTAGLLVFLLVAVLMSGGYTEAIDTWVLESLRSADDMSDALGPTWFEQTVRSLTALGGYPVIVFAIINALILLWLSGDRFSTALVAVSVIGGSALSSGLKQVFARQRPDIVRHLDPTLVSVSFPSSHATVSVVAWLTLAIVLARKVHHRAVAVYLVVAAIILATMVGLSRVYLGVHWPSDVIAGWALGMAWTSLVFGLAARFGQREHVLQSGGRPR
ncbi:hypothetical protein CSC94_03735 [Zhengella mangrovi]|uniref:Phosphatidic acid phosphatase type 2/haloperoxidase domain-containing protein n=1 Tax=Zhengella mangrovi TaxID=1982044 RepID=A0A2G1QUF8_9HYPH|nr:phosphatase PAP2 family protein [Zhengella mangrovi]PHP69094.1 hypothetical protein CSC94_03735 [Zhengella mangrovi]